jgi:hypothetical protein
LSSVENIDISFLNSNLNIKNTVSKIEYDVNVKSFSRLTNYDIILVMGQSNTYYGTGYDALLDFPVTEIKQLGRFDRQNYEIIDAIEPLHHHTRQAINIGIALPFAKLYKQHYLSNDREIVIIPCGQGSSGFLNNWWNPGDELYEDAVYRTNKVLKLNKNNRVVAILWQQGEADVWNPDYQQNLDRMITQLRVDIPNISTIPFLMGGFVPYWLNSDDEAGKKLMTNNIIKNTSTRINYTYYIDPSKPTVIEKENPDNVPVHYDAIGLRELASRYFLKYQFIRNSPILEDVIPVKI